MEFWFGVWAGISGTIVVLVACAFIVTGKGKN